MDVRLTIHTAQMIANRAERRTLDGRPHLVAPIVALVAGVINGELVTVEELSAFAEAWNGRPTPLRHPQDGAGRFVSANSPEVIEASVIGQVFAMHVEGDRLRGEMWLDVEKCERLGGDALAALNRLQRGEVLEVSTAYFCDVEAVEGVFNGEAYTAIQRNLRPDHVALLPDEIGACSIADGCGAGRANQLRGNAALDFSQSVMVAFYLRAEDAQELALATDALPGASVLAGNELHITLAYLGEIEEAEIEFARVAQLLGQLAAQQPIVPAQVAGAARFTAAEGDLDAVIALVDSEDLQRFRFWLVDALEWEVDADVSRRWAYIPHVTLAYAPTGDAVTLPAMPRRSLMLDRLALSWGDQTVEFPLLGEVRASEPTPVAVVNCSCSGGTMNEQEKKQAKAEKSGVQANEEGAASDVIELVGEIEVPALPAELTELAEALREFGGVSALMEAVKGIKANGDRQRAQIVGRLAANSRCAFERADLEAMTLDQLAKLEASITPTANYAGRGGATLATNVGDELRVAKPPKRAQAAQQAVA